MKHSKAPKYPSAATGFALKTAVMLTACASVFGVCAHAQQDPRIEIGSLNCTVAGGSGFIFGSTKTLNCNFVGPAGSERYRGKISKFGIDIGTTTVSNITWGVLAPTNTVGKGALAGLYSGVTGEATVGLGVGANALVGGSKSSIVLQPLSIQAQQGLNIAAGIAQLTLYAADE